MNKDKGMNKDTNVIRLRSRIMQSEMREFEKKWLEDTTPLSFIDWIYINHNVFLYEINSTQQKSFMDNFDYYTSARISDPKSSTYIHFVLWLKISRTFNFKCIITGTTSEQIITLYDEHNNTTPLEEVEFEKKEEVKSPVNEVIICRMTDIPREDWDKIVSNNTHKSSMSTQDYALIFHNVASYSHGSEYVTNYNESTFNNKDGGNFMTFPEYMKKIARWEAPHTAYTKFDTWDSLDTEYRKQQNLGVIAPRIIERAIDRTKARKIVKFTRMNTSQLEGLIDEIKAEIEKSHDPIDVKRLALAERYHKKLITA